jgi:UDP-glucose 4-epimerase
MKILVTGGVGFIGTNLVKRLINEGHEVHSLDNYTTGVSNNEQAGCNYISDDIQNVNLMDTDFDLIYHLAAQSRVQPSFEYPNESFRVNVDGTRAIVEFAKHNNIKVIYAGSSSKHHDPSDSPYAMYKYLGEEICKLYKKSYDVNIEICRFYNVYGPHEPLDEINGNVIGIWRCKVQKGTPIPIVGDGEQRRDFIHVDDIVDGLIKVGFTTEKHEDAWELGTGKNYSVLELYDMFKEKFWVESIHIPNQKGNYKQTLNENTDTKDRLGWSPQDRLKDYINSL